VEPVAVIRDGGARPLVEIRNRLEIGEKIEYMGRALSLQEVVVEAIINEKEEPLAAANPGNRVFLRTRPDLRNCEAHGILRRLRREQDEAGGGSRS